MHTYEIEKKGEKLFRNIAQWVTRFEPRIDLKIDFSKGDSADPFIPTIPSRPALDRVFFVHACLIGLPPRFLHAYTSATHTKPEQNYTPWVMWCAACNHAYLPTTRARELNLAVALPFVTDSDYWTPFFPPFFFFQVVMPCWILFENDREEKEREREKRVCGYIVVKKIHFRISFEKSQFDSQFRRLNIEQNFSITQLNNCTLFATLVECSKHTWLRRSIPYLIIIILQKFSFPTDERNFVIRNSPRPI